MIIDTHAHVNFEAFESDWQEVIADCQQHEIWMINVGAQLATSRRAVDIAQQYERGVYAAIGLHPIHVSGSEFHPEAFNVDDYRALVLSSKKIVAIGETGIDFFHSDSNFENQKKVFTKQIRLAKEFDLPIIIHGRNSKDGTKDAYQEILNIVKTEKYNRGVVHCYGGNLSQALEFSELGFYVGFTGIVTFDKTGKLPEIASKISLSSMLIETDSPYLAPEPHRGKRNQPQYVRQVAEKIAEIKSVSYTTVVEEMTKNSFNLFKFNS
ncbi:MAG: TatD family hydrolase [Candidatus Buchananbacteria bacterium]|nr:TatD family hydrolase [Candidatus Buchananbacteria bacterium]